MSDKVVNYSQENVERLNEVYTPDASEEDRDAQVAQLAEELGKSASSIRAKLIHLKVYVPKAKAPAGKNTIRKADLVAYIASKLDVEEDMAGSLEKANKSILIRIANVL